MLNIHGKFDPSYRYKMHKLDAKTKKNNKTYITNLDVVGKDINRDPKELIKWFGYTLGISANTKECSLNGMYSSQKLQEHLQDFINNHVLCGVCGNPETTYETKKGKLSKQCASCGGVSAVKVHPKMTKFYK